MPDVVQQISVEKEYEKNVEITREDISKLRQWLETQPHLPGNHLTELDLILVYHCCERSIEVSKQVLDLHFTIRTMFEVFFKNRVYDEKIESILNTFILAQLPTTKAHGYFTFYVQLLNDDPNNFILNDLFRTFMMLIDLWQFEEGTWPGVVVILNLDKTVLGHLTRIEVMTVKKMLYFVQECMLIKLKEIHFMNAPPFMDKLMMLLKPFIKKTLMDIIHIHPVGTDSVYQYINKEALPEDDGGSYLSYDAIKEATIKRLQSNPEFFRNENLKRVDESLRPGGAADIHDEFGIQGSFKNNMPDVVQQISVEKEYEKNLEITREDISKLRQWLETQPHLPGNHLTELDLILVYHCCERSIEVSKQVLDLHFTVRTMFDIFFKDRVYDEKIESILNTFILAPLPRTKVNGYFTLYIRVLNGDPNKLILNDFFKTFMMVFDLWQHEEGTWPGVVLLVNMDKTVLGHLSRLEVMTIKKLLYFIQECMFIKLKAVHFMNAPSFMDKLMMLLKPFTKKALMDIMHIHPVGTDSVYQYISKEALPKDDGGSYLSLETIKEATKNRLQSNSEFFRNENLKRVDESLRPGGATDIHDEFGIQGSFKKLDID